MGFNTKKRKFRIDVILRPSQRTEIYNLTHYE